MTKIYRYHLRDSDGKYWEKNIPEEHQAESIRQFMYDCQGIALEIEKEHCPQLHGHILGRDPDLH